MKDFIKEMWLPLTGAGSSISIKGIADITNSSAIAEASELASDAANEIIATTTDHNVFWYLLVGAAGAFGGLMVKIAWGCFKIWFPKLKNVA